MSFSFGSVNLIIQKYLLDQSNIGKHWLIKKNSRRTALVKVFNFIRSNVIITSKLWQFYGEMNSKHLSDHQLLLQPEVYWQWAWNEGLYRLWAVKKEARQIYRCIFVHLIIFNLNIQGRYDTLCFKLARGEHKLELWLYLSGTPNPKSSFESIDLSK